MYNSKSYDRNNQSKLTKAERKQIKQVRKQRKSKFNRYEQLKAFNNRLFTIHLFIAYT